MPRLRLLALVLLIGAAPPGAEPAYDSIVADARAFVKVSCVAAKTTCGEAKALLQGYRAALKDADACAKTACSVAEVHAIIARDRALDVREHALPPKARAQGAKRPLLRLSLLVIARAGAALTLADPKAAAPIYPNPDVEAPKMVELVCMKHSDLCGGARGILEEAGDLQADAAACEKEACPFSLQEGMAISAETITGEYLVLAAKVDTYTLPVFSHISDARIAIAKMLARASAAKLAELEKEEKAFLGELSALEADGAVASPARIAKLNARGGELFGLYRDASTSSDRITALLTGEPEDGRLRERVNASAARLASARSRLAALLAARGIGGGADEDGGSTVSVRADPVPGGAARLGMTIGGSAARESRPVLLDRRAIPRPPPADPSAPPIIEGAPGYLDILRNVRSKDPLLKADALRRLGLTKTLGDPSGRAPFVHTQKAPDTCAIVAQQGVLMALELLPREDPVKLESRLAAEAKARGYYRQGTPDAYTANLLVDRGLLVTKQKDAGLATLDAAVRRGGMIIANVDARHLWNVAAPNTLGHAIVITGAEVERLGGKTLGYYINDSGSLVLGAGRFVPIAQFKKAWEGNTRSFAEVH